MNSLHVSESNHVTDKSINFTSSKPSHDKHITPIKNTCLNRDILSADEFCNGKDNSVKAGIEKNLDRSARKKSVKTLIERTVLGNLSEENEEDEDLAEKIYYIDDDDDQRGFIDPDLIASHSLDTPKKSRARKGAKNKWNLDASTVNLTAHEIYFNENKFGSQKTSNSTLSSLELLDHKEYFSHYNKLKNYHEDDLKKLEEVHLDNFNQWQFELSQDFNICLYGFGSKRSLLMKFADYLFKARKHEKSGIVIINGYVSTITIRDIFKTIASVITSEILKIGSLTDMLETIFGLLDQDKSLEITLIIHSIDGHVLRRLPYQNLLSRLSSHPQIHLVASADHPSFPILWDSSLRSLFNFLFYDCTTYQAYNAEIDVIEEVHEILGRSGRRVGGIDGVIFVLKSLPENAKKLFAVLIKEQLKVMSSDYDAFEDDKEDDDQKSRYHGAEVGIEYRVLYQKSVEKFICSNEINFRTLLKEFNDHQIIQSKKDAIGSELLTIPFSKEELEMILKDIAS
ncbi:Origin recognition complex subunit 2 [Erysiphe neolycopersici]|uniref:Origin recognition complex subunit 2 n=1 Tax=Erysiphe neolycopersici TaxID=212602 RepID=A0A420HJM7_9PEZI|nr:Origin recognition complex subunit 2 [Erysiphe neolycopersici]